MEPEICRDGRSDEAPMAVSVPIGWDEAPATTGAAQWTIDTLHARLARLARDPWDGYRDVRRRVTAQMRSRLGPP